MVAIDSKLKASLSKTLNPRTLLKYKSHSINTNNAMADPLYDMHNTSDTNVQ